MPKEHKHRRVRSARIVATLGLALTAAFAVSACAEDDPEPKPKPTLAQTAQAGGCTYRAFPDEGAVHLPEPPSAADFKTNPPTSGDHSPEPAQDGAYQAGAEPPVGQWVHTLEHGRIILMYAPSARPATVEGLTELFREPVLGNASYHMVLMRNNTKMPFEAAAVAWRRYMACETYTPKSDAALRAFRDAFVDKGPEFIP